MQTDDDAVPEPTASSEIDPVAPVVADSRPPEEPGSQAQAWAPEEGDPRPTEAMAAPTPDTAGADIGEPRAQEPRAQEPGSQEGEPAGAGTSPRTTGTTPIAADPTRPVTGPDAAPADGTPGAGATDAAVTGVLVPSTGVGRDEATSQVAAHADAGHDAAPEDGTAADDAPLDESADGPAPGRAAAVLAAVQGWWGRAGAGAAQRWAISLVTASLVLVVGLLVADRWALMRARAEAHEAFVTFTEQIDDHEVRLDGFPFLSQVVSGRLDRIDFTADRVVLPDVTLLEVTGWATGVHFRSPVHIEALDAAGTVPLEVVQEQVAATTFTVPLLGERSFEADIDGDDLVLSSTIMGGTLRVTAEITPTEDGRGIHIHLERGMLGGITTTISELPVVGDRIPVDHYVQLDGLPENIVLTETRVVADGIRVEVEGQDVPIR